MTDRTRGPRWNRSERDAIARHHAPYFEALKREWGQVGGDRVDWIPGFRESLQSLLEQGYNISDLAVMVGVSRERVRQWCNQLDLERYAVRTTYRRVWDDELMRFRPVTAKEWAAIRNAPYWDGVREAKCARYERACGLIRGFAAEHGRAPTTTEVGRMLSPGTNGRSAPQLARAHLGSPKALERAYLDCGFVRPSASEAALLRYRERKDAA